MSRRMLDVLMRGISTRQYAEVLPEMASTCGVSKSSVSREAAEAGEEAFKELLERRFDDLDLLVIYIDGMVFGDYHVISAVWVWMRTATNTCSASNRGRRKMRRRSKICSCSWWHAG